MLLRILILSLVFVRSFYNVFPCRHGKFQTGGGKADAPGRRTWRQKDGGRKIQMSLVSSEGYTYGAGIHVRGYLYV